MTFTVSLFQRLYSALNSWVVFTKYYMRLLQSLLSVAGGAVFCLKSNTSKVQPDSWNKVHRHPESTLFRHCCSLFPHSVSACAEL